MFTIEAKAKPVLSEETMKWIENQVDYMIRMRLITKEHRSDMIDQMVKFELEQNEIN